VAAGFGGHRATNKESTDMRSALFNAYYWVLSIFYGLSAALSALLPGRKPVAFALRLYSQRMLWALGFFADVKVQLKGQENLPKGPFIIAAKHHSWGDGFVMFANVENLSFVTGDHLEKFPLVGAILKKFGAIVVDSCGGPEARKALSESAAQVAAEGRRILIFPEGHLAAPGERFRYRTGVYQSRLLLETDRQAEDARHGDRRVPAAPAPGPGEGRLHDAHGGDDRRPHQRTDRPGARRAGEALGAGGVEGQEAHES
jgi:1-acyl-sn-glycerol-3-phosphate acyltransferase